jgi:hypothetical protein
VNGRPPSAALGRRPRRVRCRVRASASSNSSTRGASATWGDRAEPLGRAKPYKISELQRDTKISRFLLARNRKFESISLQRRVGCEPDSLDQGGRKSEPARLAGASTCCGQAEELPSRQGGRATARVRTGLCAVVPVGGRHQCPADFALSLAENVDKGLSIESQRHRSPQVGIVKRRDRPVDQHPDRLACHADFADRLRRLCLDVLQ